MKRDEQKLLAIFERLAPEQQDKLIEFAEFLAVDEAGGAESIAGEPRIVPRPAQETVTMAIRRLVTTYPMLDRRRLMARAPRFAQRARLGYVVIDNGIASPQLRQIAIEAFDLLKIGESGPRELFRVPDQPRRLRPGSPELLEASLEGPPIHPISH